MDRLDFVSVPKRYCVAIQMHRSKPRRNRTEIVYDIPDVLGLDGQDLGAVTPE